MKLLTPELEARFAEVGRQEDVEDPIVIAKFFDPQGAGTWFATEWYPEDRVFFGWVTLGMGPRCDELGYFSLDELSAYIGPFRLGIERDVRWTERALSIAKGAE